MSGLLANVADLRVIRTELPPLAQLAQQWRDLEARSEHSFFMSWYWIGPWLACLPAQVRPWLLHVESNGRFVGVGVICEKSIRRHGVFTSHALFLNCTGDSDLDELTIEYNGFLAEKGMERRVTEACIEFLLEENRWDELFLDGWYRFDVSDDLTLSRARLETRSSRPVRYVNLESLRRTGQQYIESLGKNTRYHLRRSMRDFQALGECHFEVAATPAQAESFLAGLKRLHQAAWQAKGRPGAFANRFFDEFHAYFVRERFSDNVIQLVRVRAGEAVVGYLYNFVYQGHVYNYQSGFDFGISTKLKPGYWCHVHAIEFNKSAGHGIYDFMADDGKYKKDLGKDSREMAWIVVQRPHLKFLVENSLRAAKARWWRRPSTSGDKQAPAAGTPS